MNIQIESLSTKYINDTYELFKLLAIEMKQMDENKHYFQFNEYPQAIVVNYIKETISEAKSNILIALNNEKVIGFIGGKIQDNYLPILKPDKIGYILGAYVLPDYRKQGLMKILENNIISFFKDEGISCIDLNVMSYNRNGIQCWEQLGYKVFREQRRKII